MPNDTDIFGAPPEAKTGIRDADIFKDAEPSKDSFAVEESKPRLTPEQQAAWDAVMKNGWGSGAPKLMYDLGGKLVDLTGIPALGAMVSAIPDALQMAVGGNVGGAVGAPAMENTAKFLMRSAMKPTLEATRKGKAAPAVETMLDEGFNPTAGGVEKMQAKIAELSDKVQQEIANSGATISTSKVADFVRDAYRKFSKGPQAEQAVEDLGKVQENFIKHPEVAGAREIPIQTAQELKGGYQKAIGDKGYGELKTPLTEGEKQIARGLREMIGEARPSVLPLLEREAAIINAMKIAGRRVAVDANKNPIGLGAVVSTPWMLPVWMWDRSALGKAVAARGLYGLSGAAPVAGAAAGGFLNQYGPGALYQ